MKATTLEVGKTYVAHDERITAVRVWGPGADGAWYLLDDAGEWWGFSAATMPMEVAGAS